MAARRHDLQQTGDGHNDPIVQRAARRRRASRRQLSALVGADAVAVAVGWSPLLLNRPRIPDVLGVDGHWPPLLFGTAITLMLIASQRLYRLRAPAVRANELARIWRCAVVACLVDLAVDRSFGLDPPPILLLARAVLTFVLLAMVRSGYRGWLSGRRRLGELHRPLLLVGTNHEAKSLRRLVANNPGHGYELVGAVGDPEPWAGMPLPWLGAVADLPSVIADHAPTGILVAGSAVDQATMRAVIRQAQDAGLPVMVGSGLQGIASQRLFATNVGHESLLCLEPVSLSGWQAAVKRVIDLVAASALLVLTAPLVVVAIVAIKVQDRGPALFKQDRVGRSGESFTIFKLRTMVPGAEHLLDSVRHLNQRTGPLFKLARDPRVTRVGRVLRSTSIDELPQLVNVLRGEMSLVGPRPALSAEVAEFGDELGRRHRVRPGLTGLWQVEGRDDPDFEAYERLDLFYVENWSILLDLAILWSTVWFVLGRAMRAARRPHQDQLPDGMVDPGALSLLD